MRNFVGLVSLLLILLLAACGGAEEATPTEEAPIIDEAEAPTEEVVSEEVAQEEAAPEEAAEPVTLTLMTHDSFNISEELITQFEAENNVTLRLLPSGDAGSALNQAILSKNNPLADVFFGVDNTFMSRALNEDLFIPYESPMLAEIPDDLELDAEHRLTPVDYGDVCLNYDKAWFEEEGIAPPSGLADLIDPAYEGLTVVQNPATSSPGLAFLLATIATYGEEDFVRYWTSLEENEVLVVDGWESAYYGEFSAASEGDRPIVVSYASSPPAEVIFAEEELDEAPTGVVTGDQSCFRQIEFVGILRGTEHEELGQRLIDFMLSEPFQEDIPLQMFVFPANENADLPAEFVEYTTIPENPAFLEPAVIEENREFWLQQWTEAVLQAQ